jgi:hypothetical protein
MSAKTKRNARRPGAPKADLDQVRRDFNQVLWGSDDHKRFAAMNDRDLAKLVHDSEILAAQARYTLWRRMELRHQGN